MKEEEQPPALETTVGQRRASHAESEARSEPELSAVTEEQPPVKGAQRKGDGWQSAAALIAAREGRHGLRRPKG